MASFSDFDTLPPGFRFHPTDEELITHYLSHKVKDDTFCSKAIGEVDLNRVEPWDLPWEMKTSENECYYFCLKDRKYPNGMRTNRATGAGYWKATGKDREIFRTGRIKTLVGMKKTLVFYKGRAPRGEKTNWVMHEFRLEGKHSLHDKNEWVICRIFFKGSLGEMVDNMMGENCGDLPPLKDVSSAAGSEGLPHVTCFSNPMAGVGDMLLDDPAAWNSFVFGNHHNPNSATSSQVIDDLSAQEVGFMARDGHDFSDDVYGSVNFDCLWN